MPREDGYKNLVPLSERTKAEQRKIQESGGIASGAARRRKRALKEAADLFLALPVSDKRKWNRLARMGLAPEEIDNQMAVIVGLQTAAADGDTRAAALLAKILGEDQPRPGSEDPLGGGENPLAGLSTEELRRLIAQEEAHD